MKMILIFTFLSIIACTTETSEKRLEKKVAKGVFDLFIKMEVFKNLGSGDARCGGDVIGNLLGYYNNLPVYPKLQEKQEITSSYSKSIVYEYQSTQNSNITMTILEKIKIDTSSSINCSNSNNRIGVGFCNESKITGYMNSDYFTYKFAIGQIYSKSFPGGVKYFIGIDSGEKECNLKVNLKSNTL